MLKNCVIMSAKEAIGCGWKKQPDWFVNAAGILDPLLDDKARAHQQFLQTQCPSAKKEF